MFGLRGIGAPELLILLVIVVVIFGTGKLTGVGGALGKSIRDFRKAMTEDDPEEKPTLEADKADDPPQ